MWLRIVERYPDGLRARDPLLLPAARRQHDRDQAARAGRAVRAVRCSPTRIARRGQLDIEELFPTLAACSDRAEAELHACAEFGTSLLQSPWAPADLAAAFLDAACSVRPEPVAVANYAIACGRLGRWSEVRRCLESLRNVAHTEIRRLVLALEAAATNERVDLAAALPPVRHRQDRGRALRARARLKRVFSLTDGASDGRTDRHSLPRSRPASTPASGRDAGVASRRAAPPPARTSPTAATATGGVRASDGLGHRADPQSSRDAAARRSRASSRRPIATSRSSSSTTTASTCST